MREILDVSYGSKAAEKLDWYLPDEGSFDVILWFHGGGIEAGSYKHAANIGLAQDAVARGYGFVSAEYTMYPEAKFPEFLLDAAQAVAYVLKEMEALGGKRLIVSGQSAGAYLTMMLMMNEAYLNNVKADRSKILAFVSDSAQQTVHFNVLRERGMDSRVERIDDAAPLYFSGTKQLDKPLLMLAYTKDIVCRLEQNQLMLRSLKRFQPEAQVELVVLPGGHCAGSAKRNEDGQYPYLLELFRFVEGL